MNVSEEGAEDRVWEGSRCSHSETVFSSLIILRDQFSASQKLLGCKELIYSREFGVRGHRGFSSAKGASGSWRELS